MKRIALAAALLLGLTTQAPGGSYFSHTSCGHHSCTTIVGPVRWGPARVVHVPQPFDADGSIAARDAQWIKFCEPKIVLDDLGVGRYVYAHSGCEHGRTQ
jgi:hypothetical protein